MKLSPNQIKIEHEKAEVRKRMNVEIDPDKYEYIPAKKQVDYYDNDVPQRVAIYVRVSTDNIKQTTSYELQKKYYEDFVVHHPCWTLVRIYADEGISGTSLAHRDEFNKMIADCRAGKIDIIITKSVSRFARNILDCIGMVQTLSKLNPPVGVFFETESIFSLNDDSQMALSFQATMAQEESHSKSRCMETSLRMRLDHGIPLTPDLLGFRKDKSSGKLRICEEEAPTVKLAFYMYLLGYSTQEIADAFMKLGKKTRIGNNKWTSNSIIQILRSERYCGDVTTRKRFTDSYLDHKSKKNRGERPQSRYLDWHDPIVSRDDYLAVQRMLDNAKFGNKSILPKLQVITDGLLKGFVTVNPRWAGFTEADFFSASASAYEDSEQSTDDVNCDQSEGTLPDNEVEITVEAGSFDMSGFQVTRGEYLDSYRSTNLMFNENTLKFSAECIKKFADVKYIELLIHPHEKKLAVRPATKENRNAMLWAKAVNGVYSPRDIPATAFFKTLYSILGWTESIKYRVLGTLYQGNDEKAFVFYCAEEPDTFVKAYLVPGEQADGSMPLFVSGKHIQVFSQEGTSSFGHQYYERPPEYTHPTLQSEKEWKIRMDGQLFETGKKLHVTSFDELQQYVNEELNGVTVEEDKTDE